MNLGWAPFQSQDKVSIFTRDPINHVVHEYKHDRKSRPNRQITPYCNLGGLNYLGRNFRRQKGVVEFTDLTHPYRSHSNKSYASRDFHFHSTDISQFADDCIAHMEPNPFKPGH